jgi:hypothetical protein
MIKFLLKLLGLKKRIEATPTPLEKDTNPSPSQIEDNNRDKQPYQV